MSDISYSEAQAAAQLPNRPHPRTLRRWREAGRVPYCRTPGGRIYYTFEQVVAIGATMRVEIAPVRPAIVKHAPECPQTSGEVEDAAE